MFGLLVADVFADRAVSSKAPDNAVVIKVTGHQWWWECGTKTRTPSKIFTTANELHIPTEIPVKFELNSVDVIHSFWVPNLHGKKDLIPGTRQIRGLSRRSPESTTANALSFAATSMRT